MARYVLDCITVNGVAVVESPEVTVTMDCDKTVKAIYVEEITVSVRIKNTGTVDKVLRKITVIVEDIPFPAGQTVNIPYDPSKDILEIS